MPLIMNEARTYISRLLPGEVRRSSDFQALMVQPSAYASRFSQEEYRQQLAYMEARIAFMQIARELAPNVVVLSYSKAVNLTELHEFAEGMFGTMLVFSDNGMNYLFTRSEDAIFFKLTYR